MSQVTQSIAPSNGALEDTGQDIIKKFVAEVTRSAILEWRPEEFKRVFETSSRKQVEIILADLEEVRGALNGVITKLIRIRDAKSATSKEVPAIMTKSEPIQPATSSGSNASSPVSEQSRRPNAPKPSARPEPSTRQPSPGSLSSPGRPIRYNSSPYRNQETRTPLAPKVPRAPSIASGGKERVVVVYDDSVLHLVRKGLTREQYIEAWKKKKLGFQVEGSPKPDFIPSLEQAQDQDPDFEW